MRLACVADVGLVSMTPSVLELNFSCPRKISAPEPEPLTSLQLAAEVATIQGRDASLARPVAEKESVDVEPWSAHPEKDRTVGQQAALPPSEVFPASQGAQRSDV
jgi:hypothetical protein